jgi:galactokinase
LASSSVGVRGARMTGGGFGGNVIVLVADAAAEAAAARLKAGFAERFGVEPEIMECAPADGARVERENALA